MSEKKDRVLSVLEAIDNPQECVGLEGVAARFFRMFARDMMSGRNIETSQLSQVLRAFAFELNKDHGRNSSSQQEFSNLLSACKNPTMPFPRTIQMMGAFGAYEVEITMVAKTRQGDFTRTLKIPVPVVMEQTKDQNGIVYNIAYTGHREVMAGLKDTVTPQQPELT